MKLKKFISKRTIAVVLLVILGLLSVFVFSKIAASPTFHHKTLQSLEDKKITVMELTTGTAAASAVLSLIPGDSTTPIANQIARLSSYLLLIAGAIFLEKILLTLNGYLSFCFLLPGACVLYIIFLFTQREALKLFALRLALLTLVLTSVIPLSVKVSNLIEENYRSSIDQAIAFSSEAPEQEESAGEESTEKETTGFFDGILSSIQETYSNTKYTFSDYIEKGKIILSQFIDAIIILLITNCVIPVGILFLMLWTVKNIFRIDFSFLKRQNKKKKQTFSNQPQSSEIEDKILLNL